MLSFCHEMLSLKNLVSAIVTCTCRDFVGRARACEKDTKRSENSRRECYRIAVFSDISLSIPLSRNLYPGLGHVNRTVSSYYIVSSSGRRHPGRRVGLVRLVVIPTVGGMHRIIPESTPTLISDNVFHVVSPRLVEEGRNFRYIGEIR